MATGHEWYTLISEFKTFQNGVDARLDAVWDAIRDNDYDLAQRELTGAYEFYGGSIICACCRKVVLSAMILDRHYICGDCSRGSRLETIQEQLNTLRQERRLR